MTEIIDRDRAVELLEKVVEAKGRDYEYAPPTDGQGNDIGCVYFAPDGASCCLVGHVLAELDVKPEHLDADGEDLKPNEAGIDILMVDGVELTDAARYVLLEAQRQQDYGYTWGRALDRAKAAVTHVQAGPEHDKVASA